LTPSFLSGGGELGALMRAQDWNDSELGDPRNWPYSLQILVSLMLSASQPMCIIWGPRHLVLYNDAYARLMGEHHPALGRRFADIWHEIIDLFGPVLAQAFAGTPAHMDDVGLLLHRHGHPEEAHFSFYLTPVHGDAGNIAGVFCACREITEDVRIQREHQAEIERLRALFEQSPSFVAVLRGPDHRFEMANPNYQLLVANRDLIGRTAREALPELEGQGFLELLDGVYRSGNPFTGRAVPINLIRAQGTPPDEHFVDFVYQPIRDKAGTVTGIFVEGFDVTDARRVHDALLQSEERLRLTFESATDYGIVTTDNDGLITSWSSGAQAAFGWTREEALGRSYEMLFVPADREAAIPARELGNAVRQGRADDKRWHQNKDGGAVYMNGSVHPMHDAAGRRFGFIKIARDETERRQQNDARRKSLSLRNALLELGDQLRALDAIDQMSFVAAEIMGRALDVNQAGYGLIDAAREVITIERDWNAPGTASVAGVWHFRDFGSYIEDLKRGEIVAIEDTAADARTIGAIGALNSVGVRSMINLPIVEHGRFVALSFLNHAAPREWSSEEVDFMRDAGDRVWSATERLRAEQTLRRLNATLELQVETRTRERDRIWNISQDLMAIVGADGVFRAANPAWERVLGLRSEEVVGKHVSDLIHPDDRDATSGALAGAISGNQTPFESRYRHCDGGFRWLSWTAAAGDNGLVYANGRDITEEKAAKEALLAVEDVLRQSQKMEAVGQLTGGIAHDFNNLLTGIIGSLDMMQRRIDSGRTHELGRFMDAASTSAQRAAALTHRLLAFARRQPLNTEPSDVNLLVAGMEELLHRTLGEHVGLQIMLDSELWLAMADPHQLENAILNLAINARDAMPDGGLLTIETGNAKIDAAYAVLQDDLASGDYVAISVSDTGVGMSPDVIARAFDPFFTTKPIGQGTGLGLSMVYGFVKQSKGHVRIYSQAGNGSTIRLYLPRSTEAGADVFQSGEFEPPRGDGETVLVIEDDETVRLLITHVLTELGYKYLEADSGATAMPIIQSAQRIDLMITDVGLPGMNGRQLAEFAREIRPALRVLFITGYAEVAATRGGFLAPGMDMLTKPFALEALAVKIRAMIEA